MEGEIMVVPALGPRDIWNWAKMEPEGGVFQHEVWKTLTSESCWVLVKNMDSWASPHI